MNANQRNTAVLDLIAAGQLEAARELAAINEAILLDEIAEFNREMAIVRFFYHFEPSSTFIN